MKSSILHERRKVETMTDYGSKYLGLSFIFPPFLQLNRNSLRIFLLPSSDLLRHKQFLIFLLSLSLKKIRDKKYHFSLPCSPVGLFFFFPFTLSSYWFPVSHEIMGKLSLALLAFIFLHHIDMVQAQMHWVGRLYPTMHTLPGGEIFLLFFKKKKTTEYSLSKILRLKQTAFIFSLFFSTKFRDLPSHMDGQNDQD